MPIRKSVCFASPQPPVVESQSNRDGQMDLHGKSRLHGRRGIWNVALLLGSVAALLQHAGAPASPERMLESPAGVSLRQGRRSRVRLLQCLTSFNVRSAAQYG